MTSDGLRDARFHGDGPQKTPLDPRTPFQRDRDRILYVPQFRRLAEVTQVVGSHESSVYHNRLTHTLKVAQFARRLAERTTDVIADPEVVEAAALAHDIGHPPFGHIAEEELDALLRDAHVADGFEGNAQSFRIVTRLAFRSADHPGMNLTRATLQALTKYPWERGPKDGNRKLFRKYGCYDDDVDVFNWSREGLDAIGQQTPEAMLMDWADDVTYALHDLDDFVRAGLIPTELLILSEDERGSFYSRTRARWASQGRTLTDKDWNDHVETGETMFATLPFGRDKEVSVTRMIAAKANLYASGVYVEGGQLQEDDEQRRELDLLKALTWTYVIESPALASQQHGQRHIVRTLFNYYREAASAKDWHKLPAWVGALRDDGAIAARIASDVVASFSEPQATLAFSRITGSHPGSVHDAVGL